MDQGKKNDPNGFLIFAFNLEITTKKCGFDDPLPDFHEQPGQ